MTNRAWWVAGRLTLLGIAGGLLLSSCQDATAPRGTRRIPTADSLLIATLLGTWDYADTVSLTWRTAGGPDRFLQIERGTVVVTASGLTGLSLARAGVDSSWYESIERPAYVVADTLPGLVFLMNDSLVGFWTPGSVPRAAVSDSGLHWGTNDLTRDPCALEVDLMVPVDVTGLRCLVAVHWRRATP